MRESAGKRPRVLMLIENDTYPQDDRVRHEVHSLTAAGYGVSVICPTRPGQPARESVDGVNVYRYTLPPDTHGMWHYLLQYSVSMGMTLLLSGIVFVREGFDIIHAHNPPDLFVVIAGFYKLLFGTRFIFDHHDLSPDLYLSTFKNQEGKFFHKALLFFEQISCQLADQIITTNDSYKEVEVMRGQVSENRITVVRNGPDLERVRLVDIDPELRRKASIIIGYLGVIGYHDGLDYLVRALHHLIWELGKTDVYAVIIGRGEALNAVQELVKDLDLEQYICFTGYLPDNDMLRCLSTTDICLDPDPSNPFNDRSTMLKMMDYMTLGKPIVAFDLPEHRVTAQEAAIYACPNDEMDFAQKIAWLIDHPEQREELGRLGRQRIETELAWHHQAQHLLNAYQKIIVGMPAPEQQEQENKANVSI